MEDSLFYTFLKNATILQMINIVIMLIVFAYGLVSIKKFLQLEGGHLMY